MNRSVTIGEIEIGGGRPFVLIAGPCQLESRDHARMLVERIADACAPTGSCCRPSCSSPAMR